MRPCRGPRWDDVSWSRLVAPGRWIEVPTRNTLLTARGLARVEGLVP